VLFHCKRRPKNRSRKQPVRPPAIGILHSQTPKERAETTPMLQFLLFRPRTTRGRPCSRVLVTVRPFHMRRTRRAIAQRPEIVRNDYGTRSCIRIITVLRKFYLLVKVPPERTRPHRSPRRYRATYASRIASRIERDLNCAKASRSASSMTFLRV